MSLPLADLLDSWLIKGAGSPVTGAPGGRVLTLHGTGTAPRQTSIERRRGAEFRSSSFTADASSFFSTPVSGSTLDDALYVSSKIQSFTFYGWVHPQKTGLSAVALRPLGGLHSPTNMGATDWLGGAPCMIFTTEASGAGAVVVSIMGAILDTRLATQTFGPTTTTPLADGTYSLVSVAVQGDSTTNNKITSVTLYVQTADGVVYAYTLGAHRAAAGVSFSSVTGPSNTNTILVGAVTYTFMTTMTGTPATGLIANGGSTQPSAGSTITIGSKPYRFVASVSAALAATAILEINTPAVSKATSDITIVVSGYTIVIKFNLSKNALGQPAGTLKNPDKSTENLAGTIFRAMHGDLDSSEQFQKPATPSSGYDSGRPWVDGPKRFTTGTSSALQSAYTATSREIPLRALSSGTEGNSIGVAVTDPNGTWVVRVKGGTTSGGLMIGGTAAAAAYDVLIGANWAATRANLIAAIMLTGDGITTGPGFQYGAGTLINPEASAATSGGTDIALTSKKTGTAGNGETLTQSAATFVLTAFSGGASGVANEIQLGATPAATWQNLVDAVNLTGTIGLQYGQGTVVNPDLAAVYNTGFIVFTAKASGAAGNGKAITFTGAAGAAVTVKDEFRDKTQTVTVFGTDAPPFVVSAGSRPDQNDLEVVWGGWGETPTTTGSTFPGVVSDVGIGDRAFTQAEMISLAYVPPPTSARDVGWPRENDPHAVRVSVKTERMSEWPVPRALGTALSAHLPVGVLGVRAAARVYGIEAAKPWSITKLAMKVEGMGGFKDDGTPVGTIPFPGFTAGVKVSSDPDSVPRNALADLLNQTFLGGGQRRRRGYRIMGGVDDVVEQPSAFYDGTNAAGDTYQFFVSGGVLYLWDNDEPIELDDGYSTSVLPTVATIGLKTFVLSPARNRVLIEGSVGALGVTAPTSAPGFVSSTPNVAGGVVALAPGYEYVYTNYDGTKGTESGPAPSILVVLPAGSSPSTITLGSIEVSGGTITKHRVYRRQLGTETYFRVGEVADGVTTFDDSSQLPGILTLEMFNEEPVKAEFPEGTACAAHSNRLLVWGLDDRRQIAISEDGDGERFHAYNRITFGGEVRAVLSQEGRAIVYTDRTVEVIEGDWVRGSNGALGIERREIETSKGIFGPFACCTGAGGSFWVDSSGIHTLGRGLTVKDTTLLLSWDVDPIVRAAVDTAGSSVVAAYNYVSNELWVTLTQAEPDPISKKNRVVLVLDLGSIQRGEIKWSIHDHALSWVAKVQDGLLGTLFVGCDYYGNALDLDVYDADGIRGDETWFVEGGLEITAIDTAANTITVAGVTLPTSGLRGVSCVLEDVSKVTFSDASPFLERVTILASTPTTLTLSSLPSWLFALVPDDGGTPDVDEHIAGDLVYIGGMNAFIETGEVDGGTQDEKLWGGIEIGLVDCGIGRF